MKIYKIILLSFLDHSVNTDGEASPCRFIATGLLKKETKEGYYLTHWHQTDEPTEDNNITSFVAKMPGLKKQVVGKVGLV